MSDKTGSIVPCLPATPPQAFDNEMGRSLVEESRWEGDSDVGQSLTPVTIQEPADTRLSIAYSDASYSGMLPSIDRHDFASNSAAI